MKRTLLKKIGLGLLLSIVSVFFTISCSKDDKTSSDQKVKLELFSNKPESGATLQAMIDDFTKKNPGIEITLNNPPDAETILKTRLAKNDLPDIFSIGGNATFGELARGGFFMDLSKTEEIKAVMPVYLDMLDRLVANNTGAQYGIPYATNANGVIYNKEKLKALGLSVPETWDQFIEVLKKAQKAKEVPILYTLQDAWTGMIAYNSIASNLISKDFPSLKNAGKTSFAKDYGDVADKIALLMKYGHSDNFGLGYGDGNIAFANGKGVFLFQGNWALPEILKANPSAQLGLFALPVTNDAQNNKLVSGIDVCFAVSAQSKKQDAALKFLAYMLNKDAAQKYITEQKAFSAVTGVLQNDPIFEGVKGKFEKGLLSSYADHYYPSGFNLSGILQTYQQDLNKKNFLDGLDSEWMKFNNQAN